MRLKFNPNNQRRFLIALLCISLLAIGAFDGRAQEVAKSEPPKALELANDALKKAPDTDPKTKPETTDARIDALEQMLVEQSQRLDRLQQTIAEQQETIRLLAGKPSSGESSATAQTPAAPQTVNTPTVDDRLKNVEARVSELGAIKFSGDIRLRSESIFGQSNSLANGANPAVLGNDLSPRHRMRFRARLQMRGSIGQEFDWGLRFSSGSFADNISNNQTLTDFFNRKPFALDQAFVTYKPHSVPGFKLQGGKFDPPWTFTEMTIDNDLTVEGFNQSYFRSFKKSALKDLTLVVWELPFLERNSAFVRNSNGTVNIDQSRRGGRDLALYGGQVRARFEPNEKIALNLSLADLFYSGTQFISPVQVFGSQLLLPLTFTIPASGATPAQTITTQVAIARDLLVAGNANLGLTNASNNATNRDGRLASGFNLVDLLARLELKHSKRFPVAILLDFVTNTQAHDVVVAGPTGLDVLLPNRENNGFWGEIQVGKTRERGDIQFGYTFMHIEKDAVLTPFNMSDVTQQSDMRAHRLQFSYAADPRVTFTVTGIITERLNGLLGPFTVTPAGSSNRATTRLQFDTVLRF
ncbi:MAG: putative porin [Pyrinomonadaceae bacterium]